MGIRIDRLALCAGFFSCALAGCATHLSDSTLKDLGKTEVVYVTPKPEIVVTDPAMTEVAHAGKFVALTYLTGGLFDIGALGVGAYFAGNKFPGGMEERVAAARKVFLDQHWPERMYATAQAGVAASRLQGATWITFDHDPDVDEMQKLASAGGFHSVVSIRPELQMASEGDHMRIQVRMLSITVRKQVECHYCDNSHAGEQWGHIDARDSLESAQTLVAVDGGKTWEEQKQAGHKVHDLTEGDFAMFWMQGDPPPIKPFMDAAFQSLQAQITLYLGGQATVPPPQPTLKMVINP